MNCTTQPVTCLLHKTLPSRSSLPAKLNLWRLVTAPGGQTCLYDHDDRTINGCETIDGSGTWSDSIARKRRPRRAALNIPPSSPESSTFGQNPRELLARPTTPGGPPPIQSHARPGPVLDAEPCQVAFEEHKSYLNRGLGMLRRQPSSTSSACLFLG